MDLEEHTGNSAEKRKREPNFTTRELTIITENVEANKGILQSKFTNISKFQFDPGMHGHFRTKSLSSLVLRG